MGIQRFRYVMNGGAKVASIHFGHAQSPSISTNLPESNSMRKASSLNRKRYLAARLAARNSVAEMF
jgi:hypothetical protein